MQCAEGALSACYIVKVSPKARKSRLSEFPLYQIGIVAVVEGKVVFVFVIIAELVFAFVKREAVVKVVFNKNIVHIVGV